MKQFRSQIILTVIVGCFLVVPQVVSANFLGTINDAAQAFILVVLTKILGFFVWLAALLLNFSINNFVIGFGNTYTQSGVGVAVENTWIIVRDFVNLAFIFGFVYIGFKMILNASDSNTRRWLVNIIIAALLVNFSLFMVKFAIDISNQLASQIAISSFEASVNPDNNLLEVDVAGALMDRMGLSTVLRQQPPGVDWGYIFGSAMLFLTAMFVFAAGGILLIIRFAVLNLFMVLSPLMFLGFILPPLKDTFERFWKMFLGRAFFAPIYLLFIYFSLQIISGLQVSVGGNGNGFANPDWGGIFQQITPEGARSGLSLGTFPFFVLICIFLGLSVVVANKLGADGGSKAVSLGKSFTNRVRGYTTRAAGGLTAGVAARVGRNTLGRMAYNYADSDKAKDRASRSFVGKMAYKAAQGVGAASFDARQIGGVGKSLGIGEGTKGGYEKRLKTAKDEQKKFYGKDGLGFVDTDTDEAQLTIKARTEAIKAEKQKEIDENAARFDAVETTAEEREKLILKDEKLKKEMADAEKTATAELKFSRQIAYMERLKKQKKIWGVFGNTPTQVGSTGVGTATGATVMGLPSFWGGAAILSAGGIYGIAGAAAARAKVDELNEVINELDKEYGKGGAKTIGKEKSKGKAKAVIEALEEMDDKKGGTKTDGGAPKTDT